MAVRIDLMSRRGVCRAPGGSLFSLHYASLPNDSISSRISSARQTVVRSLNLIDCGYFPDLTPAHQDDLDTGMMGGIGGVACGLPIIWASLG